MSKLGLSRSKGDRKNTIVHPTTAVATVAAAAAATPVTQDIVLGKFSHHDWSVSSEPLICVLRRGISTQIRRSLRKQLIVSCGCGALHLYSALIIMN